MSENVVRKKLIHIVMQEAYEEGYAEGRRQAYEEIKWMKECKHKERMEKDFSHNPHENIYAKLP